MAIKSGVTTMARSSLSRSDGEGAAREASGGGAATSRHGPSVSAAPKPQFILSACKAVEGRCHLPMASPQGGFNGC